MKKFMCSVLWLCIMLSVLPVRALAVSEIDTFNVVVIEPREGSTPSTKSAILDTDNLLVSKMEWTGDFDSDGCFIYNNSYTLNITVKVKFGVNQIITGNDKTINREPAQVIRLSDDKREAVISCSFKAHKSKDADAPTINSFDMTISTIEHGVKKDDVLFTVSDNRLEVTNIILLGDFGENDTFVEQKEYLANVQVKVKPDVALKFNKEFSADDISCSGVQKTRTVTLGDKRDWLRVSFYITVPKSAQTLAKEAEEEAKKHKHCYCGGFIETGEHTTHSVLTFREWDGTSKITYNSNGEAYLYLNADASRETTLNIGGGKQLVLCLNGHSIQMLGEDRVINVGVGGKLYICDCTRSNTCKISGGKSEYGAGIHNNGTVFFFGGIITGNYGGYGGGVYNNANFYLYGGDIYDNKALYGGGVWNDNDHTTTFTMYNGTITLNTANCGGAIYNNDNATLVLKGGTILNNVAGLAGGGLWNNSGSVELDGGMLLENHAKYGGGIWHNGGTLLFKSGNVSRNIGSELIDTLTGNGGGIWINDGLVNMTGGEITFNSALYGGGVWVNGGSEFVMSGGVIAENQAYDGAGVYIQKNEDDNLPGTCRLSGNAGIIMNYATGSCAGAYVKGILNMNGEAEIMGNLSDVSDKADIFIADGGVINRDVSLPTRFIDVNTGDYFLEPVKWALENEITSGTSDITFSPEDKCTRGQVITFLYRMHGSPETDGFYFADTSPSDYFYDATRWAWELKMERSSAFSPNIYCTRISAIKYMWIAAGSPEPTIALPFTDVSADSPDAKAVAWALENGITEGTTETTFSPNASCTRAQIITFLYRAFR